MELPVLFSTYLVHRPSAGKVNCFVGGVQVFSFHCCTVVFGRVLWPGVVASPLSLLSYREVKQTKRGTCQRVRKLVYLISRKPVTDRHTYIHKNIQ